MNHEGPPGAVYVPPRPNLGPEPWDEPTSVISPVALVVVLTGLAVVLLGLVSVARRKHSRADARRAVTEPPRPPLIAWSDAVRAALADRFGPAWRAKTSEEIAADPALADVLGADRRAALLDALGAADRAKFAAPDHVDPEPLPAHLDDLLAALTRPAGASSTIKGR